MLHFFTYFQYQWTLFINNILERSRKNNRKLNHDNLHEANYLIFPMAIYIISFKIKYINSRLRIMKYFTL